jgi:hypothetical protein
MKTIEVKLYSFYELSETAQQYAINKKRDSGMFDDYIYDDAYRTVKIFHSIFGTKEGLDSWLGFRTGNIEDNILELSGLRLRTYIINNFWSALYKGKYYSTGKYVRNKHVHRYSKVFFENCCVLTGVCYDNSLLGPIYEFIESKTVNNNITFEDLLTDCLQALKKDIETEVYYINSDKGIREYLNDGDEEYTEDGKLFQ